MLSHSYRVELTLPGYTSHTLSATCVKSWKPEDVGHTVYIVRLFIAQELNIDMASVVREKGSSWESKQNCLQVKVQIFRRISS